MHENIILGGGVVLREVEVVGSKGRRRWSGRENGCGGGRRARDQHTHIMQVSEQSFSFCNAGFMS